MMGHHGLDGIPTMGHHLAERRSLDRSNGSQKKEKKKPASNSFQKNHQSRIGLKKTKENKNRTAWNRTD